MTTIDTLTSTDTYEREGGSPDTPLRLYGRAFTNTLKAELRAAFPGVAFRVRGSTGTGAGWYSLSWTDGPTERQVAELTAKYQSRYFSGMDDGYHSTRNPAWQRPDGTWVLGTSCGIHHERHYSEAATEQILEALMAKWNAPRPAGTFRNGWIDASPFGNWQGGIAGSWRELVWRELLETPLGGAS